MTPRPFSLLLKPKALTALSIIAIVALSYAVFFVLQGITASNIRTGLLEEQKEKQMRHTQLLSQHISSDLNVVISALRSVTLSEPVQKGELDSEKAKLIMDDTFSGINTVASRIYLNDKDGVTRYDAIPPGDQSFVGVNFSYLDFVANAKNQREPTISEGFMGRDGRFRIAIAYPIFNLDSGEYVGLVGASIYTEDFFAKYGNVHDINSQFLVAFDKKGVLLAVGANRALVGKDFFGQDTQNFVNRSPELANHVTKLLSGTSEYVVYDYGRGERLTTSAPILVEGEPLYFIQVVTPTAVIYSQMNEQLFSESIMLVAFLTIIDAAVIILIVFLLRWNSTLQKQVTQRTRELSESNNRLLNHDKMQKEFINIAAHELRTPIQPILGATEIIETAFKDKDKVELTRPEFDMIVRNAKRLERLSSDLLEVSRIESQSLVLHKELFDLNTLVSDAVEDSRRSIPSAKIDSVNIVFERADQDELVTEADKSRILEVMSNLLRNAIKFTEQGSIRATVRAEPDDRTVSVSVKDTGKGIDPDMLPKLFTKFATKSEQGTGLGLFIAKNIIDAHGGDIKAENNSDGNGATFTFSLSLAKTLQPETRNQVS